MNSIGLKKVTYYLIRHKRTGEIMPLAKRGRGYSHWNPDNLEESRLKLFTKIPRLLVSLQSANKCIAQWNCMPNSRNTFDNEGECDIDIKSDGRKKEDLEVVKIRVIKS